MENNTAIQPLGARVLVKPIEQEERTHSGLYLPETAKERPQTGRIIAVGDDEDLKLKVEDKVLFAKYSGTEIAFDGVNYLLMDANDILARIVENSSN